jgi:hypothetical protein
MAPPKNSPNFPLPPLPHFPYHTPMLNSQDHIPTTARTTIHEKHLRSSVVHFPGALSDTIGHPYVNNL